MRPNQLEAASFGDQICSLDLCNVEVASFTNESHFIDPFFKARKLIFPAYK